MKIDYPWRRLAGKIDRYLLLIALAGLLWLGGTQTLAAGSSQAAESNLSGAMLEQSTPLDGGQVSRVYFDDGRLISGLAAEFDIWTVNHGDGYFDALLSEEQRSYLTGLGLRVSVKEEEMDRLLGWTVVSAQGSSSGIPNFPCYRTVEESYADLAQMAADRPDLVQWIDIGDSWDKVAPGGRPGYDLYSLILGNRKRTGPKAPLLLIASVHPRELATTELAVRFAERLLENYGHDADITWLLDYHELHIIPYLNPDGRKEAEKLRYWRKNTNSTDGCSSGGSAFDFYGVDLNRNNSYKWGQCESAGCSSADACSQVFRGSGPASEPETRALLDYAEQLFGDNRGQGNSPAPTNTTGLFLSLHSYGRQIFYPWGWTRGEAPNGAAMATLGRKLGYKTDYSVCQLGSPGCLYQADGNTDDWMYGELGIPALTFELGTSFFESCSYFENQLLEPNIQALIYGLKAARRPYLTPAGPESLAVTAQPAPVTNSSVVTLTARMDDSRYYSGGYGDEAVQSVVAARYSISTPSWISGTVLLPMAAVDGEFDEPVEEVWAALDTRDWRPGRYLILTEGQDAEGNWGTPSATFLDVKTSLHGLTVEPQRSVQRVEVGTDALYTVTVTNRGILTDTFRIAVQDTDWPVQIVSTQTLPLATQASVNVEIVVSAPETGVAGPIGRAIVEVVSLSEAGVKQAVELITRAGYQTLLPVFVR